VLLVGAADVVLVRHVAGGSGWYEAPGVELAAGETPGRAAGRAAAERLGVEVEPGELLHADTEHGVEHYFFVAHPVRGVDPAALGGGDPSLAVIPRTELLAYRVEPRQLARRLASRRGDDATIG
jgi:ADP-ribose pyrophosphatase YjhB (NUDIX family)